MVKFTKNLLPYKKSVPLISAIISNPWLYSKFIHRQQLFFRTKILLRISVIGRRYTRRLCDCPFSSIYFNVNKKISSKARWIHIHTFRWRDKTLVYYIIIHYSSVLCTLGSGIYDNRVVSKREYKGKYSRLWLLVVPRCVTEMLGINTMNYI